MKKLLTLAFVLIMGLVIFSGCDNMNSPVEPETSNNNEVCKSSSNGIDYTYNYIVVDFTESVSTKTREKSESNEAEIINKDYFINVLIENVENNTIKFNNSFSKKAYLNKLNVLKRMMNSENYQGVIKKTEEDLIKFSEKWITEDTVYVAGTMLELTHLIASYPEEDFGFATTLSDSAKPCKWIWIGFLWVCVNEVKAEFTNKGFKITLTGHPITYR